MGDDTGYGVSPYRQLDTAKRRRAGSVYLGMAAVAVYLTVASGVDEMWVFAVVPLVGIAVYSFAGGWKIKITDMDAIGLAADAASFDFGHGSATLGFRGALAKPVWQVLVFAAGSTPDHQALVTIDALTGDVTGIYEEAVAAP
ncbi:MAG: hypothetical protein M3132_11895 [Actinomycetia bacterium]|nr:hypothetical protein [Actinomycetes bacterium]